MHPSSWTLFDDNSLRIGNDIDCVHIPITMAFTRNNSTLDDFVSLEPVLCKFVTLYDFPLTTQAIS